MIFFCFLAGILHNWELIEKKDNKNMLFIFTTQILFNVLIPSFWWHLTRSILKRLTMTLTICLSKIIQTCQNRSQSKKGRGLCHSQKKNVMAHCASPVKCNVWVGSCRNLMERKKRKRKNVGTAVLFIRFRFNKIDYFHWSSVIFWFR